MRYLSKTLISIVSISAIAVIYQNIEFAETSKGQSSTLPNKPQSSQLKITPLAALHKPEIVFAPKPMQQPPQQQVLSNQADTLLTVTSLDISTQTIGIAAAENNPLSKQMPLSNLEKGLPGVQTLARPKQATPLSGNLNQLATKNSKTIKRWQTQSQLRKYYYQQQLSQQPKRQSLQQLRQRLNPPQQRLKR